MSATTQAEDLLQAARCEDLNYTQVGDVVQARKEEVMTIPYIKDVRSRIIKNAADEFISG